MLFSRHKLEIPTAAEALPGRDVALPVPAAHVVNGHPLTGPFPEGTTNGCTVTDWYSTYRFVDDDNGNLADGTPHADILFSAFDLHAIACGAASDPTNQGAGCPAPIAASTAACWPGRYASATTRMAAFAVLPPGSTR